MKFVIKVKEDPKYTERNIDIEFPIYRKIVQNGIDDVVCKNYYKIDKAEKLKHKNIYGNLYRLIMTKISIFTNCNVKTVLEFNVDYTFAKSIDKNGFDFIVGSGAFSSSKEEFENAISKAAEILTLL